MFDENHEFDIPRTQAALKEVIQKPRGRHQGPEI